MMNNTILSQFVNKFKKDGVDHILISPFAETQYGKILSYQWRKNYFVQHLGEFTSPECFVNWLMTGDDSARHNPHYRVRGVPMYMYRNFILYAKFHQLTCLKNQLEREKKALPLVMYKTHPTGIREFDRWKEYTSEVSEFVDHILDPKRGPKVPFPWEEKYPGLLKEVEDRIQAIVAATRPEDDVPKDKSAEPEEAVEKQKEVVTAEQAETTAAE